MQTNQSDGTTAVILPWAKGPAERGPRLRKRAAYYRHSMIGCLREDSTDSALSWLREISLVARTRDEGTVIGLLAGRRAYVLGYMNLVYY